MDVSNLTLNDDSVQYELIESGLNPVAEDKRNLSIWEFMWTFSSPNIAFASVLIGFLLSSTSNGDLIKVFLAIFIAKLLSGIVLWALGYQSHNTGLSQMMISRMVFGVNGNILAAIFMGLTGAIGWVAVNAISGAWAFGSIFHVSNTLGLLIVTIISFILVFVGHSWVQKYENISMLIMSVILAVVSVFVIYKFVTGNYHTSEVGPTLPITVVVALSMGNTLSWCPYVADFSRFLKPKYKKSSVGWAIAISAGLSAASMEFVGAIIARMLPSFGLSGNSLNQVVDLLPHYLGWGLLLAAVFGTIAANIMNIYSGSLAFVSLFIKEDKTILGEKIFGKKDGSRWIRPGVVIVSTIFGWILAWWAIKNPAVNLVSFLELLSYWGAPWAAVVVVVWWLKDTPRWVSLVSFVAGLLISVILFSTNQIFKGLISSRFENLGEITTISGFFIAAILTLGLTKLFKKPIPNQVNASQAS